MSAMGIFHKLSSSARRHFENSSQPSSIYGDTVSPAATVENETRDSTIRNPVFLAQARRLLQRTMRADYQPFTPIIV